MRGGKRSEEPPPEGETIIIIMELIRVIDSLFIDLQIMFVYSKCLSKYAI